MTREQGTIIEISEPRAVGSILPSSGPPHLTFVPDSMRGCQFYELMVGDKVEFDREAHHGCDFHPIIVWRAQPDPEPADADAALEINGA